MARLILIYREEQRLVELLNNQPTEPIVVNVVEVGKGSQVCENCEKAVLDKRFYLRVGSQVFRWCSRCYRRTKHDAGFCLTHVPNQNDHGKPPPIILLNLAYLCGGQNLHRLNPPPPVPWCEWCRFQNRCLSTSAIENGKIHGGTTTVTPAAASPVKYSPSGSIWMGYGTVCLLQWLHPW